MVEFEVKIHRKQGTVYIPKEIREALGYELKAVPNSVAVLLYPRNVSIRDVVKSLDIIRQHLEQTVELKSRRKKKL